MSQFFTGSSALTPWMERIVFEAIMGEQRRSSSPQDRTQQPRPQKLSRKPKLVQVIRYEPRRQVLWIHDGKYSMPAFLASDIAIRSVADDDSQEDFLNTPSKGCLVRISDWQVSTEKLVLNQRSNNDKPGEKKSNSVGMALCLAVRGKVETLGGHDTGIVQNLNDIHQATRVLQALLDINHNESKLHQRLQQVESQENERDMSSASIEAKSGPQREEAMPLFEELGTGGAGVGEGESLSHNQGTGNPADVLDNDKDCRRRLDETEIDQRSVAADGTVNDADNVEDNSSRIEQRGTPRHATANTRVTDLLQIGDVQELLQLGEEGDWEQFDKVIDRATKEEEAFWHTRHAAQRRQSAVHEREFFTDVPQGGWYVGRYRSSNHTLNLPISIPSGLRTNMGKLQVPVDEMGDLWDKVFEQCEKEAAADLSSTSVSDNGNDEQRYQATRQGTGLPICYDTDEGKPATGDDRKVPARPRKEDSEDDSIHVDERAVSHRANNPNLDEGTQKRRHSGTDRASINLHNEQDSHDTEETAGREGASPLATELLAVRTSIEHMELVEDAVAAASQPQGISKMLCTDTPGSGSVSSHGGKDNSLNKNIRPSETSSNIDDLRKTLFENRGTASEGDDKLGDSDNEPKTQDSEATALGFYGSQNSLEEETKDNGGWTGKCLDSQETNGGSYDEESLLPVNRRKNGKRQREGVSEGICRKETRLSQSKPTISNSVDGGTERGKPPAHLRLPPYMDRFLESIERIFQDRQDHAVTLQPFQSRSGDPSPTPFGNRVRTWLPGSSTSQV